ncbi:Hypothetical predicted protein [Podarcis lilfordi]|uniref:Uncharacterized protein n=1 Tax=Podarcis lilfordi TaxID=74358 RepID=A0AA35PNN1_9SAUR|nr:Hypothetical predicted protein [Podarcis lilfordi]
MLHLAAPLRRAAFGLLSSLPPPMLAGPPRLPLAAWPPSCCLRLSAPSSSELGGGQPRESNPPPLPIGPSEKRGLRPPAANRLGVARCQGAPIGWLGWPSEEQGAGPLLPFIKGRGVRRRGLEIRGAFGERGGSCRAGGGWISPGGPCSFCAPLALREAGEAPAPGRCGSEQVVDRPLRQVLFPRSRRQRVEPAPHLPPAKPRPSPACSSVSPATRLVGAPRGPPQSSPSAPWLQW